MLLDIIVPHYKEPWGVVRPLFDVLKSQKEVDFSRFRVIFVQDGPAFDLFPSGYLEESPLQVMKITIPHKGVSAARNKGLDLAEATWVMFCDCDDSFTSIYSLMMLLYVLGSEDSNKFDLMWGSFYMSGEGQLRPVKEMNYVFIHNKFYRLSFLREHGIRFCEDLRMSEDSAFNTVVRLEIGEHRTGEINSNEPLYAWCRRPGSVTTDFSMWLENTEGHFDRNLYVLEEYRKRKMNGCDLMAVRTMTDVYAMLHKDGVPEASERFLERVRTFYLEHEEEIQKAPAIKVQQALEAGDRDIATTEENIRRRPDLYDWMNSLAR